MLQKENFVIYFTSFELIITLIKSGFDFLHDQTKLLIYAQINKKQKKNHKVMHTLSFVEIVL